MRSDRKTVLSMAVAAVLANAGGVRAVDKFWDGPVNNQWTNGNNWFTTGEPTSADVAFFDGAPSVQRSLVILGADREVSQMRVTGVPTPGDYRFVSEGGLLTAPNGVLIETGAGSVTFEGFRVTTGAMDVQSGATLNLINNNTNVSTTFGGTIFGTLNWNAGSFTHGSGANINVNGGAMNITAGGRGLGDQVSLNITNGGDFTSNNYFDIGSTADAGNGPVGTLLVSGEGSTYTQTAGLAPLWGPNGGDNATVTFEDQATGLLSEGVLMATGGGAATLNVKSGATLEIDGMTVGTAVAPPLASTGGRGNAGGANASSSSGATGIINIDKGTLKSTAGAIFLGGATVNLMSANSSLQFQGDATFFDGSQWNWTSGDWSIAAGKVLAFDGGAGSFAASSGVDIRGGSTLQITAAGALDTDVWLDIGSSIAGGATGSMTVADPGSVFTSTSANTGDYSNWSIAQGDVATITFANQGVGVYNQGLRIGETGGKATVNLSGFALLNTASLLAGRSGAASDGVTIDVDSGAALIVTGNAALRNGVIVNHKGGSVSVGGTLTMSDNAKLLLTPGGDKAPSVGALSMSGTSKIDLSNNQMFVFYTGSAPLLQIREYIAAGHSGGDWDGNFITSSFAAANPGYALGYADTTVPLEGNPAVHIRITRYGDADLSGSVTLADFNRLASNFGQSGRFWGTGDFNYDGSVNLADFNLLAGNFGLSASSASGPTSQDWAALAAAVPEPAFSSLTSVAGATLLRRRRRTVASDAHRCPPAASQPVHAQQ